MTDHDARCRDVLTRGTMYVGPALPVVCDRCHAAQPTRRLHLGDDDLCDECVSTLKGPGPCPPRPAPQYALRPPLTKMEQGSTAGRTDSCGWGSPSPHPWERRDQAARRMGEREYASMRFEQDRNTRMMADDYGREWRAYRKGAT